MAGVKFKDMSISKADYLGSSREVVVSGRKPFFYNYDLETGVVSKIVTLLAKGLKSHEHMVVSPTGSSIAFAGIKKNEHICCC